MVVEHLVHRLRDRVEGDAAVQERGHRLLVGGVQDRGGGAAFLEGPVGEAQAGEALVVREVELEMHPP